MEFNASIHKIGSVTKKDLEGNERDFLQITILVPLESETNLIGFFKHLRNASKFTMESFQGDLGV